MMKKKKKRWDAVLKTVGDLVMASILHAVDDDELPELLELQIELLALSLAAQARGNHTPASVLCAGTSAELTRRVVARVDEMMRFSDGHSVQ
jgi:hypothetical protein